MPTIRPPRRYPRTHAAHTHTAQIRHPAAHAGSRAAPAAPHDQAPRQHKSPPDYPSRTGFFFCMMEPSTAQRTRSERTTQPDHRPCCTLHLCSAGEIIHRSGREKTTSTTTAPRPTRTTPGSGPHWKPTAGPAGSSSHHAHDQTAPHQHADRPTLPPSLLWESPRRTPPGTYGGHTQTARKFPQPEPPRLRRRASEARHSVRHTARHFFKSKAQIRHILAVSHPL